MGCKGSKVSTGSAGDAVFDCVVIGGGFGGLAALRALRAAGVNAVLLTEGPLGDGQSLRCHGWYHRGYFVSMKSQELPGVWYKLSSRYIEEDLPRADTDVLMCVPKAAYDGKVKPALEANAMPYEVLGEEGGQVTIKTGDLMIDKKALTRRLAEGLGKYIGTHKRVTRVEKQGGMWKVSWKGGSARSRSVVVAAGTGTRAVLESVQPPLSEPQVTAHHLIRPIHMFCIRGPRDILGTDSVVVVYPGMAPLMLACHTFDEKTSTFYATPYPGPPKPDLPQHAKWVKDSWNGRAEWRDDMSAQSDFVTLFVKTLVKYRPELCEMSGIEFGYYGGMKQDSGWEEAPMKPHLAAVGGDNTLLALNSQFMGYALSQGDPVKEKIAATLGVRKGESGSAEASSPSWAIGDAALPNAVGSLEEEQGTMQWKSFKAFCEEYGVNLETSLK